ncbi:MAG: Asp-tRNA(Asn)/Glu-tRNA(Gln) amidotransferase subunit GatC [Burkholderiales bacterium]|jgi:aspartyl-tRNA(Asn)/glutamyl-tRNA(Gln) amidotransferase subunit C|nr:Asp-tRNA(Asn)/Glu-tRNA(Gln) amidotransferase subunit GatC [Burkholderiales bacterium]
MALSQNEIQRIAHLARIEIDEAMLPQLQQQLDSIFGMIDVLSKVNTDGVSPMAHTQPLVLPLRDDKVTEPDRRDHYQQGAPAVQDGLYLVPKVIE